MCIMSKVLIDTNVLVGFVDKGDKWHKRCVDLISRLSLQGDEVIILDVVMFEAISVLAKRFNEKGRGREIGEVIDKLVNFFFRYITWTGEMWGGVFDLVVERVKLSEGELNFNDAFVCVFCYINKVEYVASFDRDFDKVLFIKRIE